MQIALAKVFVSWRRIRRRGAAPAYATRTLVNTYLADKRVNARRSMSPTSFLNGWSSRRRPNADGRARRAGGPAAGGRAVVVLRYWADLSVEQVGGRAGLLAGQRQEPERPGAGQAAGRAGRRGRSGQPGPAAGKPATRQGIPAWMTARCASCWKALSRAADRASRARRAAGGRQAPPPPPGAGGRRERSCRCRGRRRHPGGHRGTRQHVARRPGDRLR